MHPVTDVNSDLMLADLAPDVVARVVLLDTLMQAGDRGHNMIRGGEPIELHSLDYADGLAPEREGQPERDTVLVVDPLVTARIAQNPAPLRALAGELVRLLDDATIGRVVSLIPDELLPLPNARQVIGRGLRGRRDSLPGLVAAAYPEEPR
jgi:hypothetical protein